MSAAAPRLNGKFFHQGAWLQQHTRLVLAKPAGMTAAREGVLTYLAHYQAHFGPILLTDDEVGGARGITGRQARTHIAWLIAANLLQAAPARREHRRGEGRLLIVKGCPVMEADADPDASPHRTRPRTSPNHGSMLPSFAPVITEDSFRGPVAAPCGSICVVKAASDSLCTHEVPDSEQAAAAAKSKEEEGPGPDPEDLRQILWETLFETFPSLDPATACKILGFDLADVRDWLPPIRAGMARSKNPIVNGPGFMLSRLEAGEKPPKLQPSPQQKPAPIARVAPPRPAAPAPTEEEVAARKAREDEDRKVLQAAFDAFRNTPRLESTGAASLTKEEQRAKMAEARRELVERQHRQEETL